MLFWGVQNLQSGFEVSRMRLLMYTWMLDSAGKYNWLLLLLNCFSCSLRVCLLREAEGQIVQAMYFNSVPSYFYATDFQCEPEHKQLSDCPCNKLKSKQKCDPPAYIYCYGNTSWSPQSVMVGGIRETL